jgi:DNA end-binding protein Ku
MVVRPQEDVMVGRPYWSGQLKISLVSFGVQLYPAVNTQAGITFHQIDKASGQRVRHRNVVNQDEPVENTEVVKGYEYTKGKYIVIDPEEIKRLRIPTRRVIEVRQFVDLGELAPAIFEKPYFVLPEPKESQEAFAVMRAAMDQSGKAAIGEVAFSGREHLVAIAVPPDRGRGLMAYTMRYAEELRKAEEYFSAIAPIEIDKKQLAMAADLVRAYAAPFKFEEYKDDYEAALHELIEAKQKNMPLPLEEEAPARSTGMGLMDALRRSLEETRPAASGRKKPPARAKEGPVLVKPGKRKHKAA